MREENKDLVARIREAIENRELEAHYQPQYDGESHKLISAEAVVRWRKPDGSLVLPSDFIPELEKGDGILMVDWYMLKEVCRFLSDLLKQGVEIVPISVNFSRMHVIYEKDFKERLCAIVDGYEVPHRYIEVELTESAIVENEKELIALINDVRGEGFRVAIDDFGSGVSSLGFIKEVDVDVLKLDKSLISGNCEDEKERIVLESVFHIAHRLKLETVAEGVETVEQLGFLKTCNCEKIQGYYFSKPRAEKDFLEECLLSR